MDDILDGGAQSYPVIDDLVDVKPLPANPPPVAATRNQAAITTMVADPAGGMNTYNTIMGEAQTGVTTTADMAKQQARSNTQAMDNKSLMGVLADPNVPFNQKQAALSGYKLNPALQDTSTMLQTNLAAAPSPGETVDAENARISTVDALNEMYQSRTTIQGYANALKTRADNASALTTFIDHAAGLIPGRGAVQTNKMLDAVADATGVDRGIWDHIATLYNQGTQAQDAQKYIASLPYDKQMSVAKALYQAVQDRSGFLYGNDNQHEAYDWFNKLFNSESYGSGGAFMDNMGGLMDMAFAGQTVKDIGMAGKQLVRAVRGGTGAIDAAEAAKFQAANAGPIASTVKAEPTVGTGSVVNDVAEPGYTAARTVAQDEPEQPVGALGQAVQRASQSASNVTPMPNQGALLQGNPGSFSRPVTQAGSQGALLTPQSAAVRTGDTSFMGNVGSNVSQVETKKTAALLGGGRAVEDIKQTMARMKDQSVALDINPNSPMEIAHNSNPSVARSFQEAIMKGGEEEAGALTGVDQTQALANNILPQVSHTGSVFTRTTDIDRNMRVDAARSEPLLQQIADSSVNAFTPQEKAAILARTTNDVGNATGLVTNDAMHSVTMDGNRLKINAVYEAPGGSFSNAQQAVDQAKYALRGYGIQDKDITVLAKQGVNHVPVNLDDVKDIPGDYKIQVSASPEVSPSFLDEMENLSVKKNFLDRFAATQFKNRGSVQRNLMDAASMLSKHITGPAVVAKDRGALFENFVKQKAEGFAKEFNQLSEARQAKMDQYIREANFNGVPFAQSDLLTRGFNQSEINTLTKWRDFWDDHHYLENLDIVRSLRNQGYEYFKNANAELYARPIGKVRNVSRFYDPSTDTVRSFNAGELDDLYNKGGTLARLRRPATFNGEEAEHMIVRQTPTEYTRAINDGDQVLNKLDGYYSLAYKSAKFIDEVDAQGNKIRTVAVAGDIKHAQDFIARQTANNPGKMYRYRGDTREYKFNSDENWDLNSARGRIAQRHRGQLLENADAPVHLGDTNFLQSPTASAERAAKSISGRTVMRPMLDTATQRFMQQYADVLPKNAWGEPRFPQSADEIGKLGETSTSHIGDARTTWEYLNYLQRGYINSVSDGTKALMNVIADAAGERGFSGTERVARSIGQTDLVGAAKKTVFMAYLASNPLRQIMMQSQQAWRMVSYNPLGFLKGAIPKNITEFYGNHLFGQQATDFTKFMHDSGLVESIKHHNLTSSVLTSLADNDNAIVGGFKKSVGTLRRYGFDSGEMSSIVAHGAAVYDRYKSLGLNVLDKNVQQDMHSEIRALTYDMNAAGDMPYNQGSASALFQFMQMPHKAFLNYTNRRISVADRTKMAVGDLILWGGTVDTLAHAFKYDGVPDDGSNTSEILHDGVVSWLYNHALNTVFEGTHKVDFSTMTPYGLDGWMKFYNAFMSQGAYQAILNAPSSGLISKMGNVAKNMTSFFLPKEWDNRTTPEKFVDTLSSVADLSSGWSNAHKAWLAKEYGERRDQYGTLIDDKTTNGDVIAQAFGFTSKDQADKMNMQNQLSTDERNKKQQVLQVYKDIKKFYANHYYDNDNPDIDFMANVTGSALRYYQNDPEAMKWIQEAWQRDSMGPDVSLMRKMFRSFGVVDDHEVRTYIGNSGLADDDKKRMNDYVDMAKNAQNELNQLTGKN